MFIYIERINNLSTAASYILCLLQYDVVYSRCYLFLSSNVDIELNTIVAHVNRRSSPFE